MIKSYFLTGTFLLLLASNLASYGSDNLSIVQEKSNKIHAFENSFRGAVFNEYHAQLSVFIANELKNSSLSSEIEAKGDNAFNLKLNEFLKLIDQPLNSVEEKRDFHKKMMNQLQELLIYKKNKVFGAAAERFLDNLVVWIYTRPYLLDAMVQFLQEETVSLNQESVSASDFTNLILEVHESLKNNSKFGGHYQPEEGCSLQYLGYFPSQLFDGFGTTFLLKTLQSIHDKKADTYEVSQEFQHYLQILKARNEKHFYINLMKRQDSNEIKYFEVYEPLARDEFKDTLLIATLDKNSDFYWQKNLYVDCFDAKAFKKLFLFELCGKNRAESNFQWPMQLDVHEWKSTCSVIIDEIHSCYFDNRPELLVYERQDFIEIAYLKIIKTLCEKLKPNYTNISCKETIDRGPSVLGLIYIYHCLEAGKQLTVEQKIRALTILFAPPLLSHNRPSHDPRIARFNSAVRTLMSRY